MIERFSPDEWELLKSIPMNAFLVIAGADGGLDANEAQTFMAEIGASTFLKDELHRELMAGMNDGFMSIMAAASEYTPESRERMKALLRARLSTDEYQRFFASVFISAIGIARASGGHAAGSAANANREEKEALIAWGVLWDLDPASVSKYFG